MTPDDFDPLPGGTARHATWRAKRPLVTPSLTFQSEVWSPAGSPPTGQAMGQINRLVHLVRSRHAEVLALIHANYQVSAGDENWMCSVNVPQNLAPHELAPYYGPVTLTAIPPGTFEADNVITVRPKWDPDHGLYLWFRDGRLEQVQC
jgi:hypothetical protein